MTEEVKLKPKMCPSCGRMPKRGLTKKHGCQLHGEPIQRAMIFCDSPCCKQRPCSFGGDIYCVGKEAAYEEAISAWNHRPLEDAKDARIAELEKQLKEWGSYGIVEVMIRNPNIKSFVEEHEKRIEKLERQLAWREGAQETHYDGCWMHHKECAIARVADLERQLAEVTTWRSPDTAPRDGTLIVAEVRLEDRLLNTLSNAGITPKNVSIFSVVRWNDKRVCWENPYVNLTFSNHVLVRWLSLPKEYV